MLRIELELELSIAGGATHFARQTRAESRVPQPQYRGVAFADAKPGAGILAEIGERRREQQQCAFDRSAALAAFPDVEQRAIGQGLHCAAASMPMARRIAAPSAR